MMITSPSSSQLFLPNCSSYRPTVAPAIDPTVAPAIDPTVAPAIDPTVVLVFSRKRFSRKGFSRQRRS